MSDPSGVGAIGPFLSVLRTLPLWILIGLAMAGYAVLFAPTFGGISAEPFRQQWGIWVWVEAISFSVLSLMRIIDAAIRGYWLRKKASDARRVLRFVPLHRQCWWHLAKQQDDSYISQISIHVQASNISDRTVQIVKVRLLRPRAELLHADALLPMRGSPYHSNRHPVPPHGTEPASVHIMMRGALAAQGTPIRVALGITDHYGEEYKIRNLGRVDEFDQAETSGETDDRSEISGGLLAA